MLKQAFPLSILLFSLSTPVMAMRTLIAQDKFSLYVRGMDVDGIEALSAFLIDPATGEGSVEITANILTRIPHGMDREDTTRSTKVFGRTVALPGLERKGSDLVFKTSGGDELLCGTYGVTRILRRPRLNPTGRCEVKFRWSKALSGESILKTYFVTE